MEEAMIYIMLRLVIAIVPGCMAIARDRSFFAYYMLGLLLSPLISIIVLICIGNVNASSSPVSSSSSTVNVYVSSEDDARRYVKTEVFHQEDNDSCYSSTRVAYCHRCGSPLYEDSVFCGKCGTRVRD